MASKSSAPTQPTGKSNNSIAYAAKKRSECETSNTKAKGQPSGGGCANIDPGQDPEVGTSSC